MGSRAWQRGIDVPLAIGADGKLAFGAPEAALLTARCDENKATVAEYGGSEPVIDQYSVDDVITEVGCAWFGGKVVAALATWRARCAANPPLRTPEGEPDSTREIDLICEWLKGATAQLQRPPPVRLSP
jgi:hypothetical protein